MSAGGLTRRRFIAAGAGALAGSLARPPRSLATVLGRGAPRLREHWLGALPAGARTIRLAGAADLLALEWQAPWGGTVQLRVQGPDERWSPWLSATGCGAGWRTGGEGPARLLSPPLWTGGAGAIELRASRPLAAARLHLVDASGGIGARRLAVASGRLGLASALSPGAALPAIGPGQPPILPRASWAQGVARPRMAPAYGAVRMAFVHHTETPNGYLTAEVPAMLRAIFAFHRYVRGWNDIGYNFVIDASGRIFEARAGGIDEPVVGAHAGGFNLQSTGVAVLGAFSSQPLGAAAAGALQALLAWKLALHGVPAYGRARVRVNPAGAIYSRFPAGASVWLPHIAGHRDGDSTDCPGDALYHQLANVRLGVRRLAPRVARATLALGPPAAAPAQPGGTPTAPGAVLRGSLALLGGAPVAGAQIKLQARSSARRGEVARERTLAEALTDEAGNWSLPAAGVVPRAARKVWLRAFYAGGTGRPAGTPAAVSDPLALGASLTR